MPTDGHILHFKQNLALFRLQKFLNSLDTGLIMHLMKILSERLSYMELQLIR